MIIWLILFFIIIAISFILAFLSMKDFVEFAPSKNYGIFLIQNPDSLTKALLQRLADLGSIFSLERLFRGSQSALVIYGPKMALLGLPELKLLELEDYVSQAANAQVWEITLKKDAQAKNIVDLFGNLPALLPKEQFWWQVTSKGGKSGFQTQVRAALIADDPQRMQDLKESFLNINTSLIKIPRPFSNEGLFKLFEKRALNQSDLLLDGEDLLALLGRS